LFRDIEKRKRKKGLFNRNVAHRATITELVLQSQAIAPADLPTHNNRLGQQRRTSAHRSCLFLFAKELQSGGHFW
jgi:hypothetical protein